MFKGFEKRQVVASPEGEEVQLTDLPEEVKLKFDEEWARTAQPETSRKITSVIKIVEGDKTRYLLKGTRHVHIQGNPAASYNENWHMTLE